MQKSCVKSNFAVIHNSYDNNLLASSSPLIDCGASCGRGRSGKSLRRRSNEVYKSDVSA